MEAKGIFLGSLVSRAAGVRAPRRRARVWAVWEYFLVHGDVSFCLGCGTSVPEDDEELFTSIVARFELLDGS